MSKIELDYKMLGQQIRKIRTEKKFTQEYIVKFTDLSPTHISHIETGTTKASLPSILKICNALECTPNDLLCDNIVSSKPIFISEISKELKECNDYETQIIYDLILSTKSSLRKRKFSNPDLHY